MARRRQRRIETLVGERIRALREAQGLSQADLAQLVGTSRSQVSEVESGGKSATVGTLNAFAGALGVDLPAMFAGTDPGAARADAADGIARLLRAREPLYLEAVRSLIRSLDQAREAGRREDGGASPPTRR